MTPADLARKSDALEALRAAWEARLLPTVRARVADAHAHGVKAVTDALRRTPDGRASVLKINRSPSFAAAGARLDELWAWLAGPSEVSLWGKVRDYREAAYREAARLWFPLVPPEYRSRSAPDPTADEVRLARAAAVHGYDPRRVLEGPVLAARRTLKATVEQAGRRSAPGHVAGELLAAWADRTAASLSRAVVTLLNDSTEYCDTAAGRALVAPEFVEGTED